MIKLLHTATVMLLAGTACSCASAAEPLAKEMEQFWADLGSNDPALVERAMTGLVAKPDQTVAFLRQQLHPASVADPRRLTDLLVALDTNSFSAREAASRELESLGEVTEADLQKALRQRPTAEVRRRIEELLEKIKRERLSPSADRLRAVRAVEVLERIGNCAARRALRVLAGGASEAQVTIEARTSLGRLMQDRR
jgi:hypothetical protein